MWNFEYRTQSSNATFGWLSDLSLNSCREEAWETNFDLEIQTKSFTFFWFSSRNKLKSSIFNYFPYFAQFKLSSCENLKFRRSLICINIQYFFFFMKIPYYTIIDKLIWLLYKFYQIRREIIAVTFNGSQLYLRKSQPWAAGPPTLWENRWRKKINYFSQLSSWNIFPGAALRLPDPVPVPASAARVL